MMALCTSGGLRAQTLVSSYPYTWGFENGFGGWKNSTGQLNDWRIGRDDDAHVNDERKKLVTGPSEAYEGGAYAYVDLYNYANAQPVAMTKTFDFSSLTNPILSLFMHNHWEGDNHDVFFSLEVKESDDPYWHQRISVTKNDDDIWHKVNACLSDFAGKPSVDIRITVTPDKGTQVIAIDKITIEDFIITASVTDVTCYDYQDGAITIKPSCGGPEFQYSIYAGADATVTTQRSMTYTELYAGRYNAKIVDITSQCAAQLTSINVAEPPEIEVRPYIEDIRCYNDKNGSIVVGASQAGYPDMKFEYSIDNGDSFQSDTRFSGLSGGTYYVRVQNEKGCLSKAVEKEIGRDVLLEINDIAVTNVTYCHGERSGSITVTANFRKNASVDYSIDGGETPYHNNMFQQLPAGEYHVAVIDQNKCKVVWPEPVIITEPEKLELVKLVHTDIDGCHGAANGTIDINLKGGTGQYWTTIDGLIYNDRTSYNGLEAKSYYISAHDQNNCTLDIGEVVISQPDPVEITSVKPYNVKGCHGDATGYVEINAKGGTGALTYSLNVEGVEPSQESTIRNLSAGRYFPTVTDTKGCEATYEYNFIDIAEPDEFTFFNIASSDREIKCYGQENGIINAVAQGGTLPYHYTVDDFAHTITVQTVNTAFFSDLPAGTYTVKARDGEGCETQSEPIELLQPDELVIKEVDATSLLCHNDKSGTISIAVDGGTPAYKYGYSIHGDNNFRDLLPRQVITELAPDVYDIIVTDKYQCTAYYYNITVSQPDQLEIYDITPQDVSLCYGDTNGKIIINAKGGTQPYEFSIDNGSHFQANNVFENLPAGNNYHIVVRDANKCEEDGGATLLNQPDELKINYMNYQDIHGCHGSNTGFIEFLASGGSGELKYSITGYPQQLNGDFYDIPAGSYELRVEDAHGCSAKHPGITINEPPVFEIIGEPELTHNLCYGNNNGEAIFTVRGGMPIQAEFPYKFYLNPDGNVDAGIDPTCYDGVFNYLYAGKYDVVIRDLYNCEIKTSFTITEPDLFEITSLDTLNVNTCYGDSSGYIKANITGGVQPVTFTCASATRNFTNDNGIFNKLTATQYEIIAEDNNGCQSTQYMTLIQPSQLILKNVTFTDILCHDAGTGEIRVEGDGGVGDISVSIDGGKSYPYSIGNITGVKPGDYTIMIRDVNHCVAKNTKQIKINNPPELTVWAEAADIICHEGNTGKILAQASGGTKPYSFSIDNEKWYDSRSVFDNLDEGTYIVSVKDYNQCPAQSQPLTIKRPSNKAGFKLSTYEGCSPLEFTMTQDFEGITNYTISNGDRIYERTAPTRHTIVNNTDTEQKYEILAQIVYNNGVGCSDTARQYVTVFPQPKSDFRLADTAVVWPSNTAVIANLTKNVTSAHWDFGDGTTSDELQPSSHSYPSCGNYNIILIQSDGRCIDTLEKSFYISGREILPSFTVSDYSGCEPLRVTFNNISVNADSVVWNFGDGTNPVATVLRNIDHTYTAPGSYEATLTLYGDCGSSTTTSQTIVVHPKPTASFQQNLDTIYEGQILRVYCESSPSDKYIWNFGDGTIEEGLATAEHEYKFDGTFDISLTVMTGNSCLDTAKVRGAVTVVTSPIVVFPTAFTPNGDGVNDIFVPVHGVIPEYEIIILNRNGVVVYRSKDIDEGWDGTRNGKPCLPGMYVYKAKTVLRDQTIHFHYGHIMLYR
ncbi:MAG: gliding motility-associated C-terminal domain-containing protein [Bacteroidales bacterium]|nr:gliding motility-associated C-terminal domain-containing protein [Bacteroidales bacterium]